MGTETPQTLEGAGAEEAEVVSCLKGVDSDENLLWLVEEVVEWAGSEEVKL